MTLTSGVAAHASVPSTADTVDLLTEALESLRAGDLAAYDRAVDELHDGDHWLPPAGWDALDDEDDSMLSFVWLLLEAPGDEPLLMALDMVMIERDLVAQLPDLDQTGLGVLDLVDADGETVLHVLDHRRIGFSPELRSVLEPFRTNVFENPPNVALYDNVVAMLANRLAESGYVIPPIDDLDQLTEQLPDHLVPPDALGTPGAFPPAGSPALDPAMTPGTGGIGTAGDTALGSDPEPTEATSATAAPAAAVSEAAPSDVNEPDVNESATNESATNDIGALTPSGVDDADTVGTIDADVPVGDTDRSDAGSGLDTTVMILLAAALVAAASFAIAVRRHRQHGALTDLAFRDGLTGLHNRRRFDEDLDAQNRHGARPTSVIMIDVDHFKRFNDTHGHAVGDDVLKTVGEVIARSVRADDIPYRYGGEEFSVLLPDTESIDAEVVGERIRRAIENSAVWIPDTGQVSVTASIGISTGTASEVDQLVHLADQALYRAKENGRNQLVCA